MNKFTQGKYMVAGNMVYSLHGEGNNLRNRFSALVQIDPAMDHAGGVAESVATANLFSAAPELLEALQEVVKQYESVRAAEGYPSAESESTRKAKAVIAKALGEE